MQRLLLGCLLSGVALTCVSAQEVQVSESIVEQKSQAEESTQKKTIAEKAVPKIVAEHGSPRVDGKVDSLWERANEVAVNRPVKELLKVDAASMATAKVKVLWDEQHLYALWEVTDSVLSLNHPDDWQQDSVELFLDRNGKRTVFYQYDDAQYRVNYASELSGQGEGYAGEDLQAVAVKTDSGYIVEMSILISGGLLKAGKKMGIEFQVNDHQGRQGREAVAKWNHIEDDSWEDTSNFGLVEFRSVAD